MTTTNHNDMLHRLEIRELLENWVVWRDVGDWDRFATLWHPDGRMNATWFSASATEFIVGCRKMFDAGMVGLHLLGGSSIDIASSRAIAQTKMQIIQRGELNGVEVDVTCLGRFVDALEIWDGCWRLVMRQPVYEVDRLETVDPSIQIALDHELLSAFPVGYRHLAYLQTQMGFEVSLTLPGTRGPEITALNERMRCWLSGGAREDLYATTGGA